MHATEKMYVPELIFGTLLTSSNYDDDQKKVTGGRNGYGAKLCNIFSTEFTVETACSESGRVFKQVCVCTRTRKCSVPINAHHLPLQAQTFSSNYIPKKCDQVYVSCSHSTGISYILSDSAFTELRIMHVLDKCFILGKGTVWRGINDI